MECKKKYHSSPMSKDESQFFHTRTRMRQHFGIDLTKQFYNQIIKAIRSRGTENIQVEYKYKQSTRISLYIIRCKNPELNCEVCYDTKRHAISTVMPLRDGNFYPHYYDRFGNKVNIFYERGVSTIHLDSDGTPLNFSGNLERIKDNIYRFDDNNMYLELIDGEFQEIFYEEN